MKFWIVESFLFSRTWFLFRENGVEIQITIAKTNLSTEKVKSSLELTEKEIKYFNKNHRLIRIKNVLIKK